MKKIERVSLIGLGAMGTKYAIKLSTVLEQDKFLVIAGGIHRKNVENGMIVNGEKYEFNVVSPEEKVPPADLIMLVTKAYDLEGAIRDIANHVGPDTILMSLTNGIESEEMLSSVYGKEHIIYAKSAGLGALRNGNQIIYRGMGYILFGEFNNEVHSERVKRIEELFKSAGLDYDIPLDMRRELWWKYMVNVGCNQVSAIMGADYRDYHTIPQVFEATEAVMREVVAVANAAGIALAQEDITRWHKKVMGYDPADKTSMLQDLENGKMTEVDTYAGNLMRLGKKYNVPTPLNEFVYLQITAMQAKNQKKWEKESISE